MVFSSTVFLFLFLPFVLVTHFLVPRRARNLHLLLASLFFYAWGETFYVGVMIASIAANFVFGRLIEASKGTPRCRTHLALAVAFNLLLLGYFKYTNFFVDNLSAALAWFGMDPIQVAKVHLPIGISFFTFQALSYVVDVYRRVAPAQRDPIDFGLFIALFPQLIAGPIVRYGHIAKELTQRTLSRPLFAEGISRFIVGLGKKMLIANTLAEVADPAFAADTATLTASAAWLGLLAFTLQVYFDFAGYSDMAIGLGKMMGFTTFPENFDYPLIGRSIRGIWQRWHMSMTTWFRDYLYYPLGGSRCSPLRAHVNLVAVFVLCGLWHGAAWNFVVFGLYHGLFLIIERMQVVQPLARVPVPVKHLYAMTFWLFGIVIFRTDDLSHWIEYTRALFGGGGAWSVAGSSGLLIRNDQVLAFAAAIVGSLPWLPWLRQRVTESGGRFRTFRPGWAPVAYHATAIALLTVVLGLSVLQLAGGTTNPFIYFRF